MSRDLGAVVAAAIAAAGISLDAGAVPAEIVGEPIRRVAEGPGDDLLSAGLGLAGIRGDAPGFADPLAPTASELRRRAVHTAYRGLVDVTDAGGFGRLFGPRGDRRIVGVEYLAAVRTPDGAGTTTVMLQIPSHFDPQQPCLVVASSSGSRGIYGGVPTAGEWGLEHGCAVAYTDKGTGVGFFDLDSGTGYRIDLLATRDADDPLLTFRPADPAAAAAFAKDHPHRVAVKHAHSQTNPEKDWGLYVLQAAKAGFGLLNAEFPGEDGAARFTRENTLVIASGVSNGGGAVLRAVEQDAEGLLDAAVVSEPNAWPGAAAGLAIRQGERAVYQGPALSLYDYSTLQYLLQPAAILAPADPASPLVALNPAQRPLWEQWSASLAAAALVAGETQAAQAADARAKLEAAGLLPEALELGAMNVQFGLWPAIATAYASAHGRLPVDTTACGVSFAATDDEFKARALTAAELAKLAADGSGVPPTGGVQLVTNVGGGIFASLGSLDAALCLRSLATGEADGGKPAAGQEALASRVRSGIEEVRLSASLRGKPVMMLHGRRDALVPVNHTSRAYYARHRALGEDTLRYYEVEHGQHFDAFIPLLPGWSTALVPLQPKLVTATEIMYRHLTEGAPLPPSQVVRSTPRRVTEDGGIEPLESRHLGALVLEPGGDAIVVRDGTLFIPD